MYLYLYMYIYIPAIHRSSSLFAADFRAGFRGSRHDHQGHQVLCALEGLVPCGEEGAALHIRGLHGERLRQQRPIQLLLRSAPGPDVRHVGRRVRRPALLRSGREFTTARPVTMDRVFVVFI